MVPKAYGALCLWVCVLIFTGYCMFLWTNKKCKKRRQRRINTNWKRAKTGKQKTKKGKEEQKKRWAHHGLLLHQASHRVNYVPWWIIPATGPTRIDIAPPTESIPQCIAAHSHIPHENSSCSLTHCSNIHKCINAYTRSVCGHYQNHLKE